MKINNRIHFFAYLIIILLLGYLVFQQYGTKRTAVVNAQLVLENYEGFKEAQNVYEDKTNEMSKTFEKQKSTYESKSNELKILSETLSEKELKLKQDQLVLLKAKTLQLGKAIEDKAVAQEEKLLQGVYNRVNDFIERYAKDHGIDLITGIASSGNVLYVSDEMDITEDIIKSLNKEYVEGIKE